jgi:hypothetical protein
MTPRRGGWVAWGRARDLTPRRGGWVAWTGARAPCLELGTQSAPAAHVVGGRLDGEGGGNNLPHPGWGLQARAAERATAG